MVTSGQTSNEQHVTVSYIKKFRVLMFTLSLKIVGKLKHSLFLAL